MSTVGGAFTETELLQQRVLASSLALDDRIKQQFVPQIEILKAIDAVNTNQLKVVFNKSKKVFDVEIMWENFCDIVATTCASDCSIGGNKSSTNTETKTLACFKEAGFTMSEADFIDNEFDVNIAKALLKADKELAEAFAQYAVAQLEAFKGANALTTGKGVVAGLETTIDPAYWNASLFAYFNKVAIINKFTAPILVSGNNLYEAYFVAKANAGNSNGKGDAFMFGTMPIYFDLFNIDTVNTPDFKTYMLSRSSLAMVSKAYNPDVPEKTQDFTRYKMRSSFIPSLEYDVFYKNACDADSSPTRLVDHHWTLRLTADIFNNPAGCTQNNSGILSFKCA